MTQVICRGVEVRYRNYTLGPIDIDFEPGITCLVGANGAGKSTFFRALAGIERFSSGDVSISRTGSQGGSRAAATRVGLLPQDVSLPPAATVTQYLTYCAWLAAVPRQNRRDVVARAVAAVGLDRQADTPCRRLSGGMVRRVGLAQALVGDPDVVLLDEPTVGLDPVQRDDMRRLLVQGGQSRVTILATHLLEDVRAVADRVVVLRSGRVVFTGTVPQLEATADTASGQPLESAVMQLLGAGSHS